MKFLIFRIVFISFIVFPLALDCYSQEAGKKSYTTVYTKTPPVIDGLINDECWKLADWSSSFIQSEPNENKPPSQETAFKILYDEDNLYVLIRAYDNEPGKISRIMSRRDNFSGDLVSVEIDSYFDKQTAFSFTAMASGAKGDEAITGNGNNYDDSWNPVWYLKTSVDDKGWLAEMKIPYTQLRFGKKDMQTWGLQVKRYLYRKQEMSLWQFIPKGSPGFVHLYGELTGIANIRPKHQAEIMPYTVGRIERFEKVEGDPFQTGKSSKLSAGLDGKIGLTNDFTLDLTINPDFGQVEADPSEVNLTAFESYFSEKRPFFVEGKNIFQFFPYQTIVIHNMYSDNLFYSRRIGRYPQFYPNVSENEYVRMPESTSILGSIKISGKTKKGLSVGILESLTSREDALIDSAGSRIKVTVEPLTNYFVGRVQKDFNKGETTLGGMVTAVNRDIRNPDLDFLHTAAYTTGIDFRHSWKERAWYLAGNAEYSNLKGKPQALLNTQTSSARYFQRPDQDYLSVDSSLTSMAGYGGSLKFGKTSQKRLQFETSISMRSPGLEFNDIGYMRYSDVIHHGSWVGYYIRNPFLIFNNLILNSNYWMYWNFSGKLLSFNTNINIHSQFKNLWRFNGQFNRQSESLSTTLLRGGPSIIIPGNQGFNVNLSTDMSKKVGFMAGIYQGSGDVNSLREQAYFGGIELKPSNSISLSIEPEYDIQKYELQYVGTEGTKENPIFLFGQLDQKTLAIIFRINYTISPALSIEYYGQPFLSAGKYTDYKRITSALAARFQERFHIYGNDEISYNSAENAFNVSENGIPTTNYSFGNPDFNFRQFRSNLVIRWEYLPGSTLFLVWSQGRTSTDTNGMFSYRNDMKGLFSITPQNVFLIKFSYWFAL